MKLKRALKFYFCAEEALARLDRLILAKALSCNDTRGAEYYADVVASLIEKKAKVCAFYAFIDGAMYGLSEEEREYLKKYAESRSREALPQEIRREVHRLSVLLVRRMRGRSARYAEGAKAAAELCFFDGI